MVHKDDRTGKWGDTDEKPKQRSMYSSHYLFEKWINHTMEFAVCLPEHQETMTIMALHSQDGTWGPFYIVASDDEIIYTFNGHNRYRRNIVPDEWLDMKIETNLWSHFKLTVNDEIIINEEPEYKNDTVNFKIGCYVFDNGWSKPIRRMYFQI